MLAETVDRLLDESQIEAYRCVRELLRRAAFGRQNAAQYSDRTLLAFERALVSGSSTIDPDPWRRFIEELSAEIAFLEAGPLPKYQGAWLIVLREICEENRDLLVPPSHERGRP